jgi:uridine kinase
MRLATTPRVAFLRGVAEVVLARCGRGRMIVAVTGPVGAGPVGAGPVGAGPVGAGPVGAGAAAFADDLRAVLEERDHAVFRAGMDGFLRSRHAQAAFGEDTPERFVRFGLDEPTLLRSLVEPFRLGGSTAFVTRVHDAARDAWVEPKWITGPEDAILLLDGRFLLRERLARLWDYRIAIDGDPVDAADVLAYAEHDPRDSADLVVDLGDPAHPREA